MRISSGDRLLDRTFFVSLILKGLDGVLELIGGVVLLVVTPSQIQLAVAAVTRGEFAEDPNDLVATLLVRYAGQLNVSLTLFGAWYLLVHGVVKVLLVGAVLRDRLWAYPWLIGFLVAFVGYQSYELVVHYTWGLLLLTLFDVFILYLTYREYRRHKSPGRQSRPEPSP
ncbi:Uncharacterized membrane protein [Raineyella antarctica]|uniref:Uncharacterized membrane protein n=1 Tax=Raineyella antarctica TaxID=1577474 RepID=A0A1G6HLV4_9ACTN|nr:DUF2127 domain-containing protein [Raineyella antarctica]SDB95133.1 Uncharacterized membrane protein [Raineyella antarctica]